MSRILQLSPLLKLKLEFAIVALYHFFDLEHTIWEGFVVTATNHEDPWILEANLHHLEIMGEILSVFNEFVLEGSQTQIVN